MRTVLLMKSYKKCTANIFPQKLKHALWSPGLDQSSMLKKKIKKNQLNSEPETRCRSFTGASQYWLNKLPAGSEA